MSETATIQIAADVSGEPQDAAVVKQVGFHAIALNDPVDAAALVAKVEAWRAAGLEVCSVNSGAVFGANTSTDPRHGEAVDRLIEQASRVQVGRVVIDPPQVDRRMPVSTLIGAYGDWLALRADRAASVGVRVLVSNGGPFGRAADLWKLIDRLEHAALGVCWDTLTSARQGEPAALMVSVLNSRINMVRSRDGKASVEGAFVECPLGDGTVGVEQAFKRLRGIGFVGCASVSPDAQALARVNEWSVRRTVSDLEAPFQKKAATTPTKAK